MLCGLAMINRRKKMDPRIKHVIALGLWGNLKKKKKKVKVGMIE